MLMSMNVRAVFSIAARASSAVSAQLTRVAKKPSEWLTVEFGSGIGLLIASQYAAAASSTYCQPTMLPPVIAPIPISPAPRCVLALEAETKIGGCGFCTGFGVSVRGCGNDHHVPSWVKGSSVNAFTTTSSDSCQIAFVFAGSTPKAWIVLKLFDRAVPSSTRPSVSTSSVEIHSATRAGLLNGSSTTDVGRRWILLVRAATYDRNDSGAETVPLFCAWCLS